MIRKGARHPESSSQTLLHKICGQSFLTEKFLKWPSAAPKEAGGQDTYVLPHPQTIIGLGVRECTKSLHSIPPRDLPAVLNSWRFPLGAHAPGNGGKLGRYIHPAPRSIRALLAQSLKGGDRAGGDFMRFPLTS